jgi:hypothetical protein
MLSQMKSKREIKALKSGKWTACNSSLWLSLHKCLQDANMIQPVNPVCAIKLMALIHSPYFACQYSQYY